MTVRIGISCYWRAVDVGWWAGLPVCMAPQSYVEAVAAAGGLPILIPPVETIRRTPGTVLDLVQGLVLVGGEDIDPELYGEARDPATQPPQPHRDRTELALFEEARRRDLPVLAICRGAQLLNVAYGGSLVQDIEDSERRSRHVPQPGVWGRHEVALEGGNVRRLLGKSRIEVASHHHQALGRTGSGLAVTALSSDGLVEGVEDPSRTFCVGVLWHPEEDRDGLGQPLFHGLTAAARLRP